MQCEKRCAGTAPNERLLTNEEVVPSLYAAVLRFAYRGTGAGSMNKRSR